MIEDLKLLTVKEVAEILRVSHRFVYQHSSTARRPRRPIIRSFHLGGAVRYRRSDLEKFIGDYTEEASR